MLALVFHPELWGEVERVAKATKNKLKLNLDMRPLIERVGIKQVIHQLGLRRILVRPQALIWG